MMKNESYEIQELVEISGVPRRNIYFYVQQGLLPPPAGAGLAARYSGEHLLRLRLIPQLRGQGLRLDQIREQFKSLSPEELEGMLVRPLAVPKIERPVLPRPLAGQACTRYDLPGGIVLIVPAGIAPEYRLVAERILRAAEDRRTV
jgi:DNA-binding transcriptional MerR regulator